MRERLLLSLLSEPRWLVPLETAPCLKVSKERRPLRWLRCTPRRSRARRDGCPPCCQAGCAVASNDAYFQQLTTQHVPRPTARHQQPPTSNLQHPSHNFAAYHLLPTLHLPTGHQLLPKLPPPRLPIPLKHADNIGDLAPRSKLLLEAKIISRFSRLQHYAPGLGSGHRTT